MEITEEGSSERLSLAGELIDDASAAAEGEGDDDDEGGDRPVQTAAVTMAVVHDDDDDDDSAPLSVRDQRARPYYPRSDHADPRVVRFVQQQQQQPAADQRCAHLCARYGPADE